MIRHYSNINFEKTKTGGFKHNLEADFACFVLWENAFRYREKARTLLSDRFDILLETEVIWSDEHFHQNANRLYELPILEHSYKKNKPSLFAEKIGGNTFILFIIKDVDPEYTYAMSVSKQVELSNLNTVKAKYEMRDWVQDQSKIKNGIHSTNNIQEFFFQAPLFLGANLFKHILTGKKIKQPQLKKDLEGAQGWESYEDLFEILNLTSNYLVQRGFEPLPKKNDEKDIDFLADNYQRLASALGVRQSKKRPYKGYIKVNKEVVSVDIRFLGDKYYDVSWQKDMLQRKITQNNIFIPREDDYFFSLLFHCKVQKDQVKSKYFDILEDLARKLNFTWYNTELLSDDKAIGEILKGYFESHGYYYETPIDPGVFRNNSVAKHLPKNNLISSQKILLKEFKKSIKRALPDKMVVVIKKALNK